MLDEAGYVVLDSRVLVTGVCELLVRAPDEKTGAGEVELRIDVPGSYPFMPPQVFAEGLSLPHHQHPFNKNLCLIQRSTKNWIPEWRLAGLLNNQLKRAITAGMAAPGEAVDEFDQGEPFSVYYTYRPNSAVLCDVQDLAPSPGDNGMIRVSLLRDPMVEDRLVGTLDEIVVDGKTRAAERVQAVFGRFRADSLEGRWIMLDQPPNTDEPEKMWELAEQADPLPARENSCHDRITREIRLVSFPEENGHNSVGVGWVFLVKERDASQGSRKSRRAKGAKREPDVFYLLPAYRAGRDDLIYRSPETRGLATKAVMVIGCGAIGSVLVEHLARAGVGRFKLVDFDRLEPGNLSRHACGIDMAGADKVIALAKRLWEVNPHAEVIPIPASIGSTPREGEQTTETDAISEAMESVDLVIDATAEIGCQQYTSVVSRSVGTTWICVDGTPGVGGGCVVRIDGDGGPCYACHCWHQYRGSIPTPTSVIADLIQPAGCSAPTFSGTGFDLAAISIQATRVAVGALLRGSLGGYPEDGYDVYVLELRDEQGNVRPPSWTGYELTRHDECPHH
jgi:hypothetical protein